MIVADSNLIAYLLIRSEHTSAAEAVLLKDAAWAAPLLWRSEVRNVLAHYLRQRHLSLADALEYMKEAEDLLRGREYEIPSAPVLALSQQSGCTAYDCEFVHLAQHLNLRLVTSDNKVLRAFQDIAISPQEFTR